MTAPTPSYREPARDGFPVLPFWEVKWYNLQQDRALSDTLTSEAAALNFCTNLLRDEDNINVLAIRVDWIDRQIYPDPLPDQDLSALSREELEKEVLWLRRINKEQGLKIRDFINGSRIR